MRKVKIFIGSSIDELRDDRIEIGNFFRQLNDLYLDSGLYFQLVMCEDYDDAIELDGKQSRYDKEILDSELSVFIFYKKVGTYTEHEFEIAYNQFRAELRPKILTVFKCASDGNDVVADVKFFAERLDKELRHYYKTYSNPDSLKLWLIMQIKSMSLDQNKIEYRGGKVLVNNEVLAIYENAPAFSNYDALSQKKQQLKQIQGEYLRLKAEYLSNPDDIDVYLKYCDVAKQKSSLEEDVEKIENSIVSQLESIYKLNEKGELSEKQILGYRLMEAGKYDQALEVLNSEEIFLEVSKNEKLIEFGETVLASGKRALQVNVNELLQRVEALKINGITLENASEIEMLYSRASELSQKYLLESKVFFDYVHFLNNQKNHKRALEILLSVQERIEKSGSWEERVDLWHRLANAYYDVGDLEKGCAFFEKTLKTVNGLITMDESEKNMERAGKISYDFSIINGSNWNVTKCEELSLKAIEWFEKLFKIQPDKYVFNLALSYIQLAWAIDVLKKGDSLEYYKKAYDLVKDKINGSSLTVIERRRYANISKNYAAHLTHEVKDFSVGSEQRNIYDKACEIVNELAMQNPVAHDLLLASFNQNYGYLITKYCPNESPEEYLLKSHKTFLRVKTSGRLRNLFSFSISAERLADYYAKNNDGRAEEYYKIAVENYEQMGGMDAVFSKRNRAQYYYDAGMIYKRKLKDFKKCAIVLKKSLAVYGEMDDINDEDRKWIGYIHDDFKVYNLEKYLKED